MSHLTEVKIACKSLTALEAAAKEFGGTLVKQSTYRWYGRYMENTPLPAGMTEDQLGKCSYAIKLPGVNYEVGCVLQKDGSYTLAYDYFGGPKDQGYEDNDGHKLTEKFGEGLQRLVQQYSRHAVAEQFRKRGWCVVDKGVNPNGTLRLEAQRL